MDASATCTDVHESEQTLQDSKNQKFSILTLVKPYYIIFGSFSEVNYVAQKIRNGS